MVSYPLIPRSRGARYLLHAPFKAADQGFDDAQVLDTSAEGVVKGQLTVVEQDSSTLAIANRGAFTSPTTPAWYKCTLYGEAFVKVCGLTMLIEYSQPAAGDLAAISWHRSQNSAISNYGLRLTFSGATFACHTGSANSGAIQTDVEYQIALVLGGFDASELPYYAGLTPSDYLYGGAYFVKGGLYTTWTLMWMAKTLYHTPLYPTFFNNGKAGMVDNMRVPVKTLESVLRPNNVSLYASAGELSAYAPEVGGGWTEDIGDWDTVGGVLIATVLGIASFTGLAECVYDTAVTTPGAGTTPGGLIVRASDFTGASEDYWYAKITPGTAGTDWELIELAAGAATQRGSKDADFAVSTEYDIRVITWGARITIYVDGADRISFATATSGQTAAICGLRDEGNGNMTFDKTLLYPRTDQVQYDNVLNKY